MTVVTQLDWAERKNERVWCFDVSIVRPASKQASKKINDMEIFGCHKCVMLGMNIMTVTMVVHDSDISW